MAPFTLLRLICIWYLLCFLIADVLGINTHYRSSGWKPPRPDKTATSTAQFSANIVPRTHVHHISTCPCNFSVSYIHSACGHADCSFVQRPSVINVVEIRCEDRLFGTVSAFHLEFYQCESRINGDSKSYSLGTKDPEITDCNADLLQAAAELACTTSV
mmetsp:Transcript_35051/g.56274  ORF Transcript_35051/g.56274 Transcript_35051/m.56274 type:complete len:159 (+) Transcript_35051:86-562(+)